jgi:hypothetical protein
VYDFQQQDVIDSKYGILEEVSQILQPDNDKAENALVPNNSTATCQTNIEDLDATINSMMDKLRNSEGRVVCKVCGHMSRKYHHMKNHIEAKHIEGISHPCNQCGKSFGSRNSLAVHISSHHKPC